MYVHHSTGGRWWQLAIEQVSLSPVWTSPCLDVDDKLSEKRNTQKTSPKVRFCIQPIKGSLCTYIFTLIKLFVDFVFWCNSLREETSCLYVLIISFVVLLLNEKESKCGYSNKKNCDQEDENIYISTLWKLTSFFISSSFRQWTVNISSKLPI